MELKSVLKPRCPLSPLFSVSFSLALSFWWCLFLYNACFLLLLLAYMLLFFSHVICLPIISTFSQLHMSHHGCPRPPVPHNCSDSKYMTPNIFPLVHTKFIFHKFIFQLNFKQVWSTDWLIFCNITKNWSYMIGTCQLLPLGYLLFIYIIVYIYIISYMFIHLYYNAYVI